MIVEDEMDLKGAFQVFGVIQCNSLILHIRKPQPSPPTAIGTFATILSIRVAKSKYINEPSVEWKSPKRHGDS